MHIAGREIGTHELPFIITEIGINHGGDFDVAVEMVEAAHRVGAECVKFQCHIPDAEMVPNDVVPPNANESIWDMMNRCALGESEERKLKNIVERLGMIYLSTPFSALAVDRLERLGVSAYKVGSGEVSNPQVLDAIAATGKPVIMSTGMHSYEEIDLAIDMLETGGCEVAVLHCNSMYPTPLAYVRLGMVGEFGRRWPGRPVGFSDHSQSIYPAIASVALGASIIERHFTDRRDRKGPDIEISDDPFALSELRAGTASVFLAMQHTDRKILDGEFSTRYFARSSVCSKRTIAAGDTLTDDNITAKRPGNGDIPGIYLDNLIGTQAQRDIPANRLLTWEDVSDA